MTGLFKIALGIGAAAAATAMALSLAKKNEEANEVDEDEIKLDETECLDECDDCSCEDCEAWNGEECECDEDCGSCECEDCCENGRNTPDIKTAVNNIVDGVMGGIVIAADKVSELSNKLADFVAEKLDERKEAEVPEFKFDWEDEEEEAADEVLEGVDEAVAEAAADVKEAFEDVAEAVEEAAEEVIDAVSEEE